MPKKKNSVGNGIVQYLLVNTRAYAATKVATGNTKYVSRGLGITASYLGGMFGATLIRALYVREINPAKSIGRELKEINKHI